MTATAIPLPQLGSFTPYVGYAYAYPHKTAYRALTPPRELRRVWEGENKGALFLYLHVPFCEMRCGFCNLFTTANPPGDVIEAYLEALERQVRVVREAIGQARYARMAIGGGTPTCLSAGQLARLFHLAEQCGVKIGHVPTSVETSPRTAERDRLQVLKDHGVDRVSIGVQSFIDQEVASAQRAERRQVESAIGLIRELGFRTLNVDLIYGLPQQTVASWVESLKAALRWRPEELYLYPLYVRPLTGLNRHHGEVRDDLRLACYRAGRELLLSEGYEQKSMRMFHRRDAAADEACAVGAGESAHAVIYCCQEDGMVGLGCGARSYTRRLHYSTEYAVGAQGVRRIIDDFVRRDDATFAVADYGFELDEDEQKRRWVIKSLLRVDGLDAEAYGRHFGTRVMDDVPELAQLLADGWIAQDGQVLRPTPAALEWSDAIGPWLYSPRVRRAMQAYELH